MLDLYIKIWEALKKAQNVLIVSHRKPDADTLGAAISLAIAMQKLGKKFDLACIDKPSRTFGFLPLISSYISEFNLPDYDLMIIVDSGASHMTGFQQKYENFFELNIPIINIDHHASNDNFGTINLVDPDAACVTVILYRMFNYLGITIDFEMATCLLAGIYGDTGSFMHANTSEEVYSIAAELLGKGAKIVDISKAFFRYKSVSTLRLWGSVLENVTVTDRRVVMSIVKEADYERANADPEQLSGVIDYLNMVPDSDFALLINEDRKGNVKGSFRTRKADIDLSRIAGVFGGGGHAKASGFTIPGKIDEKRSFNIVSSDMSKKSLDF